jgi:hypothetical protein
MKNTKARPLGPCLLINGICNSYQFKDKKGVKPTLLLYLK